MRYLVCPLNIVYMKYAHNCFVNCLVKITIPLNTETGSIQNRPLREYLGPMTYRFLHYQFCQLPLKVNEYVRRNIDFSFHRSEPRYLAD